MAKETQRSPAVILTSPEDLRKARLNQPRVSREQLRANEEQHRQALAESIQAAKSATSNPGREKAMHG